MTKILALVALLAAAQPVENPWASLVPGRYVLIGREPDGGATYTGEATIKARGRNAYQLRRTVAGKTVEADGKVEVPSPGEGQVLRFRWREGGRAKVATCLVSSDLDNYGRLSCLWVTEGQEHKTPGLEAYFSNETWQSGP
jgi:hypothetical protein